MSNRLSKPPMVNTISGKEHCGGPNDLSTVVPPGAYIYSCLCRYRYKAIRRYRAAHDDIWGAISKKDKALQKVIKNTDLATLVEISEEAVTSSGMGIYRQKNRVTETSGDKAGNKSNAPTERPEQLRQKFAQNLKVQWRSPELLRLIGLLTLQKLAFETQ